MTPIKFDPEAIRELAKILRETDLTEIELVEKDSRIRVARVAAAAGAGEHRRHRPRRLAARAGGRQCPHRGRALARAGGCGCHASGHGALANGGRRLSSPEPGAPPYVTPGARVAQGQTLLLIEAMKTFNQIKAPRAGW